MTPGRLRHSAAHRSKAQVLRERFPRYERWCVSVPMWWVDRVPQEDIRLVLALPAGTIIERWDSAEFGQIAIFTVKTLAGAAMLMSDKASAERLP